MDKKRLVSFLLAFFFSVCTIAPIYADIGYGLSMSLDILAEKSRIKKCGVKNTVIYFDKNDFVKALGEGEYVTVSTLPDKALGTLYLGDRKIKEGQTLTLSAATSMHFEPNRNTVGRSDFTFSSPSSGGKYGVMTLFVLEEINLSPYFGEFTFDTAKNISHKGYLEAVDPEGDDITYSVTVSPRHGTLRLIDAKSGFFMYTPKVDFTGRDTFSVRATDSYGNRSETKRIILHVNETENTTVFYDMTNHWAHLSASRICASSLMKGVEADGKLYFEPEKAVTRGDFLAIAMISAGLEPKVEKVFASSFYDDSSVPVNIKSYAQAALTMGIVSGYEENGNVLFKSTEPITRQDAALIISRILEYCGSDEKDAYSAGILVGTGKGERAENDIVTRAQTAKIYCNMKDYFETSNF